MANLFNSQYEDLASQGRYGDTMLAHITPEEAALLKARGGAGTINPQTGLPEFYGLGQFQFLPQIEPEPLPSLGQILNPDYVKDISTKLNTITVPEERRGLGGVTPAYEKVGDEYSQYANRSPAGGMGSGRQIEGYTVPTDKEIQGQKLSAIYDAKGNFQYLTMAGDQFLTPDTSQPNIIAKPKINAKGELIDAGVFDVNQEDDGGFGSFIGGLIEDFAPMIIAGLTANFLGPGALPTTAGATGAAAVGSGALSPYAAQAAGAYGGSSAAAAAAAAGSLSGIADAALGQNTLTQAAINGTGLTFDPSTVSLPETPQISSDPSFKADYSLSKGGGEPGIKATNQASFADPTVSPVDYSLDPVSLNGGPLPAGPGMKLPSMPALNSMNGGQGLTTPAFADPGTIPGTVGAKGLTPFNAVPDLGDPKSFINNPDVTGLPRLNSDIPPTTNFQDLFKNIGEIANKFGNVGKGGIQGGSGGGLGDFGSLQFGQSFLPGSSYSAPESSMVKLKEQAIVPALAAVLQQRGMNVNQPSFAGGGRVHRPEFITGKTGHYAQGRGTGQSDDIPAVLHDGDYVVDADTVAAFGDGSSKAGAGALEQFRKSMPEHHSGGGQPIRAQIADGEYVLPAGFVTSLGRGSNKNGAKMLDAMREEIRAHKRSAPDTKIPPKAKKPMQYMREAMKG
jgi:hypothetical protein